MEIICKVLNGGFQVEYDGYVDNGDHPIYPDRENRCD